MLEESIEPLKLPPEDTAIEIDNLELDDAENTTELEKTNFGDLYILGKLWIDILQTGLIGYKWNLPPLLPVVKAAPPPPPPKKPPKMKYQDLPLYATPHFDYKDYIENKDTCPEMKRKLINEKVLPYVKSNRKYLLQNYTDFVTECASMKKQALCRITKKKNEFICYMRCEKNLQIRQGVLAFGGLGGYLYGRRFKDRYVPRLIFPAVGLLAAGALCFPKETDETFRTISLATGKFFIELYNKYCNKKFAMRERLPCTTDLPKPCPPRTPNKCPEKKN